MTEPTALPPAPDPRPWARIALGGAALVLIPLVLALIVLAAKFRGIGVNLAMEHAQIARHVAGGEGLSTGSLRPISLAIHPGFDRHPDLCHAPAHPLLLGLVFRIAGVSERADAAFGLLLWFISVLGTFALARRWYSASIAALAAGFYGCNVAMIKSAVLGLPYPLCALLVLGVAAVAAPGPGADPEAAAKGDSGSPMRLMGAGLLAGLAAMSHYVLFFFAPAVGAHLVLSRRRRWRAALLFLVGLGAAMLPWMIRNYRWGRSPFFSLYWFEALAGTDSYPGDVVWRSMANASTGPWEFVFAHPFQTLRKVLSGLFRFWNEALPVADPMVTFLFAAAVLRSAGAWRGWLSSVAGGILLSVGASCLYRPEPEILLAWTPILAIPAAAQAASWLTETLGQVSLRRYWSVRLIPSLFRETRDFRALLRRAAALAVLAVVAFPLTHYLWIYRAEPPAIEAGGLSQLIPAESAVITDQPAAVAWKAGRRAVWLCQDEKEWDLIERGGGRIDAAYLSPSAPALVPASKAGWWWWLASPRGIYRGLSPVESPGIPGVVRLRGRERG